MASRSVGAKECTALGGERAGLVAHPNHEVSLGDLRVTRALPIRDRRMVGPWCFLDRFGPIAFGSVRAMDVPPHPHIGLQTVSWLLEGEVLHSDSLGFEAVVRPGGVNIMTSGRGIAHAEETPAGNSGRLNGVQLWVALPDAHRDTEPSFVNVERVPVIEEPGGAIQLFAGGYGEVGPVGPYFSEIAGMDVEILPGGSVEIGLSPEFEHAVLVLEGECAIEGQLLQDRTLYYLGTHRSGLSIGSDAGGRILLIGGPPFPESILMWWNFVARTPEEIVQARADWEGHRRFGDVAGDHGPRLAAPDLVRFARPNPVS